VSAGPLESLQLRFRVPSTPFLSMVAAIGWFGASVVVSGESVATKRAEELA
jgi:purine-cytosine permease-like protein